MAVTRATFIVQFPEFTGTDVPQVEAVLAAAELEIDRTVWGVKGDQGQMYLAAHKLNLSAYGNDAQLKVAISDTDPFNLTHNGRHYRSLRKQVAPLGVTVP